jgi:hypothetical protein
MTELGRNMLPKYSITWHTMVRMTVLKTRYHGYAPPLCPRVRSYAEPSMAGRQQLDSRSLWQPKLSYFLAVAVEGAEDRVVFHPASL